MYPEDLHVQVPLPGLPEPTALQLIFSVCRLSSGDGDFTELEVFTGVGDFPARPAPPRTPYLGGPAQLWIPPPQAAHTREAQAAEQRWAQNLRAGHPDITKLTLLPGPEAWQLLAPSADPAISARRREAQLPEPLNLKRPLQLSVPLRSRATRPETRSAHTGICAQHLLASRAAHAAARAAAAWTPDTDRATLIVRALKTLLDIPDAAEPHWTLRPGRAAL